MTNQIRAVPSQTEVPVALSLGDSLRLVHADQETLRAEMQPPVKLRRFTVAGFASFIVPGNLRLRDLRRMAKDAYVANNQCSFESVSIRASWCDTHKKVNDNLKLYQMRWLLKTGQVIIEVYHKPGV